MTIRGTLIVLGAALLLTPCADAQTDLTTDECRTIAQAHSSEDLADVEAQLHTSAGIQNIHFIEPKSGVEHRVNATHGYYVGWVDPSVTAATGASIPEDEAVQIVRQTATEHLGKCAEDLEFTVRQIAEEGFRLHGTMPPSGDPPRYGMGPKVNANVRPDGSLSAYTQTIPRPEDAEPAPVAVTAEEAQAIASSDLARDDFALAGEPRLIQHAGEARWALTFTRHAAGREDLG
ncbi:MAG: hypothetical protein GF320_01575, partial [Armatimonadia bacterium]|nr:hypothetical protein [Armatimonadia bacterium]